MRTAFLITALAAVAIAFPHPQETDESLPEDPDEEQPGATLTTLLPTLTALPIPSTSLNIPITTTPSTPDDEDEGNSDSDDDTQSTTSRRRPHREPLPVFSKQQPDTHAGPPMPYKYAYLSSSSILKCKSTEKTY
jgi:hypothetical protein